MALPGQIVDREYQKFVDIGGNVHVRTISKLSQLNAVLSVFTGSVTTASTAFPTVAGNNILTFSIKATIDQTASRRLEYSLNGGTNWFILKPGDSVSGEVPFGTSLTQILLRASASTTAYELTLGIEQ